MKKNDNNILNELKDIAPLLAETEIKTPYLVSSEYFTEFLSKIKAKITAGAEPHYYFPKEAPYTVPSRYFQNLSNEIFEKVSQQATKNEVFEEMKQISPLLNKLDKRPVNTVPAGYWESSITAHVVQKEGILKQGKVVSLTSFKKFYKYLAAAILIGIVTVGMFLFIEKPGNGANRETKPTAAVKKLSEQEIIEFLKTTSPADSVVLTNRTSAVKDNEIKASVSRISDKEINQFLEENEVTDEM